MIGEFIQTMQFWFYIFMAISFSVTYYYSQNYMIALLPSGFLILIGVSAGVFESYFSLLIFFALILIIAIKMAKSFLGRGGA